MIGCWICIIGFVVCIPLSGLHSWMVRVRCGVWIQIWIDGCTNLRNLVIIVRFSSYVRLCVSRMCCLSTHLIVFLLGVVHV